MTEPSSRERERYLQMIAREYRVKVVLCSLVLQTKAIRRFVITENAPTRAFSWLKAATTAFTFKTQLRHYAKRALTPRSLKMKLGPSRGLLRDYEPSDGTF